jgi:thiamine kinase-like enzyme
MNLEDLENYLKKFADTGTSIKIKSTYRNFVFYLKYKGEGIYVKFCSQYSNPNQFNKERTILTLLPKINPLISLAKVVKDFPSNFNEMQMNSTYELSGSIIRDVAINRQREALLSWVRAKKVLHDTSLNCNLAHQIKCTFEPKDSMYLYLFDKWQQGLLKSRSYAPLAISRALKHLERLIQIASDGSKKCLIQGDASLENAIFKNDGSVGLIDFEKAMIGDPLWDLFGFVRDHHLITQYKNEILHEAGYNIERPEIEQRIGAITSLSAIEWLSNLNGFNKAVAIGHIKGITFQQLVNIASIQFEEGLQILSLHRCS